MMNNLTPPVKSRIRVTNYSPFRGLEGTIQIIDQITDDLEEPLCFYLIVLEGASITQPVWFETQEIELIDAPALPVVVLAHEAQTRGGGDPYRA